MALTEKDVRTVNNMQQKLKMLEDTHQDLTEQQQREFITTLKFDINGMDILKTGFEPKIKTQF
jgi:hypothetical protein